MDCEHPRSEVPFPFEVSHSARKQGQRCDVRITPIGNRTTWSVPRSIGDHNMRKHGEVRPKHPSSRSPITRPVVTAATRPQRTRAPQPQFDRTASRPLPTNELIQAATNSISISSGSRRKP